MASTEGAELVRPAELTEWDIKQAQRLIELSQQEPLPSLLTEHDLMSCLYYPLRQVPLPQFQFEMLLWESDKLNIFSATEKPELSRVKVDNGVLLNPAVLYKRADDFTVLGIAYSLESRMAAIYTNEISQTSWEIVGVFSARELPKLISSNRRELHTYETFEEGYTRAKAQESGGTQDKNEDAGYWNRYDEELDTAGEPAPDLTQKTEEEYWQMYDDASKDDEGTHADTTQEVPLSDHSGDGDVGTKMLLNLVPLYRDCGLDNARKIASMLREAAVPNNDGQLTSVLSLSQQIAWRHTCRTVALIKEQFGSSACEQAISEAAQLIGKS